MQHFGLDRLHKSVNMATPGQFPKLEIKIDILKLHEEIFREIFRHLEVDTLYFTLREVCTAIKKYVDNYVK